MPFSRSETPVCGLTPRQIVAELDKFIIGQRQAKRMVAIALRNRERRRALAPELADEISPKNILMIGPTGVGKTEIARRLAKLAQAPFVKVEATKYTEVGYVGRDVESMVRDLVEAAVRMARESRRREVEPMARASAEIRLADLLLPPHPRVTVRRVEREGATAVEYDLPPLGEGESPSTEPARKWLRSRQAVESQLREGRLEDREVEVNVTRRPAVAGGMFLGPGGGIDMGMAVQNLLEQMMPAREARMKVRVARARQLLIEEETDKLLDMERITAEGLEMAQERGILFIDEIDKVAGRSGSATHGPDVSREGVQRDLLPIVEGCSVPTKYGTVETRHMLFIAAGAFHTSKPSDLIPELQGRLPLRCHLEPLDVADFRRILVEPDNALTRQYQALLATENVDLVFTDDGLDELAQVAGQLNRSMENIGARRLHTVLERTLEDVSFEAADMGQGRVVVDRAFVRAALSEALKDQDVSRYIL